MYIPAPKLRALLDQHSALQLLSSKEIYPDSAGEGLPLIKIQTPLFRAIIALQGAHLLEFQTAEGSPLLWVSPNCNFTKGTALRGGIPVCLPWFGVNPRDSTKPKHGFARNQDWELCEASLSNDGSYELTFNFFSEANDLFAYHFSAQLRMILGRSAKLELTVNNIDSQEFDCSWALHSYHPITSLNEVKVVGLAERTYLDNLEGHASRHQHGDVSFPGEVDRVYPAIENSLTIVGTPQISITHANCPSVIVWNPGKDNATMIADIGAGQEQHYICVERGAVLNERWRLTAGESKTAWLEITEIANS